ncbi:MAG: SUMF1/EgtB/PvdO family nonheme iron enzyme [Calditrichaeota bacterium]|nr:SUMF1/EgtB/PvdO family nonheme iron enzyme [Calditrichota bacterium]
MRGIQLLSFCLVAAAVLNTDAFGQVNRVEFNGHEYAFVDQEMTWTEARDFAEGMGGYLVCIGSSQENTFVAGLAGSVSSWIGLREVGGVNNNWQWVNDEPVVFTNWASGEPNNGGGTEWVCQINYQYQQTGLQYGKWDDGQNDNSPYGNGTHGIIIEWDFIEHIEDEYFNNSGTLPSGWTIQSQSATLTTPWAPVQEAGDDWVIQTSQTAFSVPQVEWLISPVYSLAGYQDIELGYSHSYTHASSSAIVKYSVNGGVAWQNLTSYSSTSSGDIVTDIASWADGATNVRFAFVFTGQFVVGGASWRIDDFYLDGVPTPPVASAPIPAQPPTNWNGLAGTIGCSWTHPLTVSGTDLEVRIDSNGDGDYSDGGSEDWTALPDTIDAGTQAVTAQVAYAVEGLHQAFEFRARSGNGLWGYSGTSGTEGIADDWYVSIVEPDSIPPTSSTLLTGGSSANSVTLLFSPTVEDHFARYEFRCSTDSLVDESDLLWTDTDDPSLAQLGTYATTVTGLASGTAWYFRMWAVDQAGNRSSASNRVRKVTEGSQVSPVTDLHAAVQGNGIQLTWTAPTADIYGQTPVAIEHFEVHSSVDPFFVPSAGTLIGTTTGTSYFVNNPGGDVRSCFKMVAVGAGPGQPFPIPLILVPAGTFMMGPSGGYPEYEVSLTHQFQLGQTEVTNSQYLAALQWAYENSLVTVANNHVYAHGQIIVDLSVNGEITFSNGTFELCRASNAGAWGYQEAETYDPTNHPVKEVTWYGAACYCDWISEQHGLEPYYQGRWNQIPAGLNPYLANGYRLPTEAEWEYAAQFGDDRIYPWGNNEPSCELATFGDNVTGDCVDWTYPVGSLPLGASSLGLQDMAGNVWEWCNDWYSEYDGTPQTDPIGPYSGINWRIRRGGCWVNSPNQLACAYRNTSFGNPGDALWALGFRVCRTVQ